MKKLLLTLVMGILCIPFAKAMTINDLDGKMATQIYLGNVVQGGCGAFHSGGYFKVEKGQLYIKEFFGEFDVPVTWDSSTNTLTIKDGTRVENSDGNILRMDKMYQSLSAGGFYNGYNLQYDCTGYGFNYSDEDLVSRPIKADSDDVGTSWIEFPISHRSNTTNFDNCAFLLTITKGSTKEWYLYFGLKIQVYDKNATAVSTFTDDSTDTYGVKIDVTDTNFTIANFLNSGPNFNITPSKGLTDIYNLSGTNDVSQRKLTLPVTTFGAYPYYEEILGWCGATKQKFYYNNGWNSYTLWYKNANSSTNFAFWITDSGNENYYDKISSLSDQSSAVTATYVPTNPVHRNNANQWVSNGGSLKTYGTKINITFGGTQLYNAAGTFAEINNTVINDVAFEMDVTHAVQLGNTSLTVNPVGGIDVACNIQSITNNDFVSNYDLYLVPERISSISGKTLDAAKGLANGVLVKSNIPVANKSVTDTIATTVSGFDALADELMRNKNVALYLKANYTKASGLAPTFHALTPVSTVNVVLPAPSVVVTDTNGNTAEMESFAKGNRPKNIFPYGTATVTASSTLSECTFKYAILQSNLGSDAANPTYPATTSLNAYADQIDVTGAATLLIFTEKYGYLSEPYKLEIRMYASDPVFHFKEGSSIIAGPEADAEEVYDGIYTGEFYTDTDYLYVNADGTRQMVNVGGTYTNYPFQANGKDWIGGNDEVNGHLLATDKVNLTVDVFAEWGVHKTYKVNLTRILETFEGTEYVPFSGSFGETTVQIGNSEGADLYAYIICAEKGDKLYGLTRNRDEYNTCFMAVDASKRVASDGHFFNDRKNAAAQFLMEFLVGKAGNDKYYLWSKIDMNTDEIEVLEAITGFKICEDEDALKALGDDEYGFLVDQCRHGVLCTCYGEDDLYLLPKVMVDFYNRLHADDDGFLPFLYKFELKGADSGSGGSSAAPRRAPRSSCPVLSFSDKDKLNVMALDSENPDTMVFRAGPNVDEGANLVLYTTKDAGTTTPVETIKIVDPACPIIVDNGAIIVLVEGEEVAVYNTVGAEVYRGAERRIRLNQGIYIVVVDGHSYKVAVK